MIKKSIKIGEKFNKLTIIKEVNGHIRKNGYKERKVLCRCKCGNIKEILYYSVKSGKTKSCGCLFKEKTKIIHTKHGMNNTKFYYIFGKIKQRCFYKNCKDYKYYGGRGIKCEWKSFIEFRDDMYKSYLEHKKNNDYTSIDRMNNDKNYNKKNCRWATRKEQMNNRKNNHFITFNGKTQTIAQWADELNIKYQILERRINRNWSIEKSFNILI